MKRRNFMQAAALGGLAGGVVLRTARADVPEHNWDNFDFGNRPKVLDRLNQGPLLSGGDRTIGYTSPSDEPIRNYGLGLVGYTWEENGPSLAARAGKETIEQACEKLAALPFMDVLYIRCDWRDVQSAPGKLNLNPVWKATFDAARRHNLRVGFRIQLSSPNFQPRRRKKSAPSSATPKPAPTARRFRPASAARAPPRRTCSGCLRRRGGGSSDRAHD